MGFIFIGLAAILFFFMLKGQLSGQTTKETSAGSGKMAVKDYFYAAISKYAPGRRKLIEAICKVESNGKAKAYNQDGPSYGLMQITPILAQTYGLIKDYKNVTENDIKLMMNVSNNSEIGCRFFYYLHKKYPRDVAIQMYNLGESGYNAGKRAPEYLKKVLEWFAVYSIPWSDPARAGRKLFP
jgi:soluble lytic murein transglycosylase-like protein